MEGKKDEWNKLKDSEKLEFLFTENTVLRNEIQKLKGWNHRIVVGIREHLNGRGTEIIPLIESES